jgi:hypothetical protein
MTFQIPFENRDFKVAFRVPMRDLFWVLAQDWDHSFAMICFRVTRADVS